MERIISPMTKEAVRALQDAFFAQGIETVPTGGPAPEQVADDFKHNRAKFVADMLAEYKRAHTPVKVDVQPGRNDPCPCGSGKKFKKCHIGGK